MRSPNASRRTGLTLVEVVAALALLGTLAAGVLTARAAHVRQDRRAAETLLATEAADRLLTDWTAENVPVPTSGSGVLDEDLSIGWRTHIVANAPIERIGGQVVRLTVIGRDGSSLFAVDLITTPPPPIPLTGIPGSVDPTVAVEGVALK